MANLPKVDGFELRARFARSPIHIEPKGWGREVWIANNTRYCGKILEISSRVPRICMG